MNVYIEQSKAIDACDKIIERDTSGDNDVVKAMEAWKVFIESLPPADVAPVRRGKWFDSGSLSCRCDQCGCKNTKETPFCPFCGAKMDGGKS